MKRHVTVALLLIGMACAGQASADTVLPYTFLNHSTVLQTGGFAGVYEVYAVRGTFQLRVDYEGHAASFDSVEAALSPVGGFLPNGSLADLFNMTELAGTVINEKTIEFVGPPPYGPPGSAVKVEIKATFQDDLVRLTGGYDGNAGGGADFFIYELTAAASLVSEPATLTWDGTDPGEWTGAHWGPGGLTPGGGKAMVVDSGTVTVSSDLTAVPAASLSIASGPAGGTVNINGACKLVVTGDANVGVGGTLRADGVLAAAAVNVTGGRLTNSRSSVSPLTVQGDVALADGGTLVIDALGAGSDKLAGSGGVTLGADSSLEIVIAGGGNEGRRGTYALIEADGGLSGTFANVTDLGAYVSVNGDGLTYDEAGGTVTLTLDMDLNPADANLDGATDVSDRIIWSNNNFTYNTTFVTGDWNNDGLTDVSDRIIWNKHNFTFATPASGAPGARTVPVPEPATLSLLILGHLAGLRRRRRSRRPADRARP